MKLRFVSKRQRTYKKQELIVVKRTVHSKFVSLHGKINRYMQEAYASFPKIFRVWVKRRVRSFILGENESFPLFHSYLFWLFGVVYLFSFSFCS